ncbi:Haloacid dehalogenase-like hydrolase-domain-containing protein [Rhodocollybia butyracea]|uniref:Haloacid dehalogenase-like hydrolase-domain-containing protein n=1 Tax=Rhodocollybia butyracea TaxID=206335 RepID=A0A9P5PGM9_9AGAR|nr:Haloacid dehalogenase-like hydrolase-domain-containing protein [Rhodocollybia butyracea]
MAYLSKRSSKLSPSPKKYDAIIFDLGDVLFAWSALTKTSISPQVLRSIIQSTTWFKYERGEISEEECYATVALEKCISVNDVRRAFQEARESLTSQPLMTDLIRELKPGRGIYAMSNISAEDFAFLQTVKSSDMDLFDHCFTSSAAGKRKPDILYFHHVLERTGADPSRTIYVDDKLSNVQAACSLGMAGILYEDFKTVERTLRNLCFDSTSRGESFLKRHAGQHLSYTSTGVVIYENFAQLLILEATRDPSLVKYTRYNGPFNFFRGVGELTTRDFPCDVDTTSIGITCSDYMSLAMKNQVMDAILDLRNPDGIPQVYFDASRPRTDPAVCVNVLTLFHKHSRGQQLKKCLEWVESVLRYRGFSKGTRYYEPPEAFLFFLTRLFQVAPDVHKRLAPVFADCCRERLGIKGDALALAMRVVCCNFAGINASGDLLTLQSMQEIDGGWPDGWFYKYGLNGIRIANRGFTTAIAINAIKGEETFVNDKPVTVESYRGTGTR